LIGAETGTDYRCAGRGRMSLMGQKQTNPP